MKRLYASIWYNDLLEKWKLDEAIVVENDKITNWGVGGTFHYGPPDESEEVLKEALIDLLFFDPEKYEDYQDKRWQQDLKNLIKETEVKFVSSEEIDKLKKKYPEAESG